MQQYWLAFTYVKGIGTQRIWHLRDHFGSVKTAWFADSQELRAAGIPTEAVEHHHQLKNKLNPESLLEKVQQLNAWVVTPDDSDYPSLLRELEAAPVALYGRGTLTPVDQRAVAIVGTRRASDYGKEMTRRLATGLAEQQITIISGLAHGIDTHAHQFALQAGGRTIAIMGCGIDQIYPSENRNLAHKIVENGAILTEFAPGTKPERYNFPIRNRIISGMSLGTVVIEAPDKSGSLHTAEIAGEQGRDVFAVPGNATSPNSIGTNRLIQDGAKLVMAVEDILRELDITRSNIEVRQAVKEIVPTNAREAEILKLLGNDTKHVDELCRMSQLSIQEINATMALMELKGMVLQTAPMIYQRIAP